jgi:glucose-6-phosphate 1-epimerase
MKRNTITSLAVLQPSVDIDMPDSVWLEVGDGGLTRIQVRCATGEAEIYLQGAHVKSWQPVGQQPVLWMSRKSRFEQGAPIRGGVPLCFPWFGVHPEGPQHGWARIMDWTLERVVDDGETVTLTLSLSDSPESRASAWPHAFDARFTVTVGATLGLRLVVTNRSNAEVDFEESFHTYFAVSDVRNASISGLAGLPWVDATGAGEQDGAPLRVAGPVTRVYTGATGGSNIADAGLGRTIVVRGENAANVVVWNPWSDQARSMPDFGDDEWAGMVCVETANLGESRVRLAAGATHSFITTISTTSV